MHTETQIPEVSKIIDAADRRTAIRKQLESLKASSLQKLVTHKEGGVFTIDQSLIGLVAALSAKSEEFAILDDNSLPIIIRDGKHFYKDILAKYQEVVNQYAVDYNKIRTSKLSKIYGDE